MDRQNISPTTYIIIGFVITSLVIIGIIALFYQVNSSGGSDASYTDPKSGETVVSPAGKSPETVNTNPDAPIYLGFSSLLEVGFSDEQVQATKDVLLDFVTSKNEKNAEISLDKDSIKQKLNSEEGTATYAFNLIVNRKQAYSASILISDIYSVDMSLYSDDAKTAIFHEVKGR